LGPVIRQGRLLIPVEDLAYQEKSDLCFYLSMFF